MTEEGPKSPVVCLMPWRDGLAKFVFSGLSVILIKSVSYDCQYKKLLQQNIVRRLQKFIEPMLKKATFEACCRRLAMFIVFFAIPAIHITE